MARDEKVRTLILVVDDVGYFRLFLRRYLETEGHGVMEAGTALEALDLLSRVKFDLVILDYKLPDIDGLTLFQRINEGSESDSIDSSKLPPFILCTASLDDKAVRNAAQMGFFDIFAKPVNAERLLKTVRKALASRQPDA